MTSTIDGLLPASGWTNFHGLALPDPGVERWGIMLAARIAGHDRKKIGPMNNKYRTVMIIVIALCHSACVERLSGSGSTSAEGVGEVEIPTGGRQWEQPSDAKSRFPQSQPKKYTSSDAGLSFNLDGDWISSIESNHHSVPSKNLRHLIFSLRQDGNSITATDSTGQVRILGKINGRTIDFRTTAHRPWGFFGIKGQWLISKNGNQLEGRWSTIIRPAGGIWNLRRFDNRGIELYMVETGPGRPFYIDDGDAFFDRVFRESKDRNVVFFIHGRGENFRKNFEPEGLPEIELQSNTRFVILRWLSWGGDTVRPIEHAASAAKGLSRFLAAFDDYRARHPERVRHIGVTLMAHSMGNIPLMVFLQDYHESGSLRRGLLDAVVLSSPDVPLQGHAEWVEKIDFTDRVYIVQHRRDLVLRLSKKFFYDRQEWQGRKLGIGTDIGEAGPGELAGNALYLDVTDLTLPISHRHFDMSSYSPSSRIYRLYQRLLSGQGIRYPDPEIGVFEPPGYERRLVLSVEDSREEAQPAEKEIEAGR